MAKRTRNPMLPLFIGAPIILAAAVYVGFRIWTSQCEIPTFDIFLILGLMPTLYLALMYLAFKSQP